MLALGLKIIVLAVSAVSSSARPPPSRLVPSEGAIVLSPPTQDQTADGPITLLLTAGLSRASALQNTCRLYLVPDAEPDYIVLCQSSASLAILVQALPQLVYTGTYPHSLVAEDNRACRCRRLVFVLLRVRSIRHPFSGTLLTAACWHDPSA